MSIKRQNFSLNPYLCALEKNNNIGKYVSKNRTVTSGSGELICLECRRAGGSAHKLPK